MGTKEIVAIGLVVLALILLLLNQLGLTGYFLLSPAEGPKRYVCSDGRVVKDPGDCPTASENPKTEGSFQFFEVVAKCNQTLNGILLEVKSKVAETIKLKQVNVVETLEGRPVLRGLAENVEMNATQKKTWWVSDFNCTNSVKVEITYEDSSGLKKDSGEVRVEIYS